MRRGLAAAVLLTVFAGSSAPLATASQEGQEYLVNDEIAVASLDPRGLPIETHLISRIASSGGPERTILDPSTTTNVEYLNQRGRPDVTATGINVTVGGPEPRVVLVRGLFDKPMPVALHAEYSLNGKVVDPGEVVGASGTLQITYTVTNIDAKEQQITYTDAGGTTTTEEQPVFAPFVGNLMVTAPEAWEVTSSSNAVPTTDESGDTVLTWNLLLFPPLGDYQQEASFTAEIGSGSIPETVLAVAPVAASQDPAVKFSDDLLQASVKGNDELASGVSLLAGETAKLAAGAGELARGLLEVSAGASEAAAGVDDTLVPGADALAAGAAEVAAGQRSLAEALALAVAGAEGVDQGAVGLADGIALLADGLGALGVDGLVPLQEGAELLRDGTAQLSEGVGQPLPSPLPTPTFTLPPIPTPTAIPTPSGTPSFPTTLPTSLPTSLPTPSPGFTPTLVQTIEVAVLATGLLRDQLVTLNNNLLPVLATVGQATVDTTAAAVSARAAETAIDGLLAALCSPPQNPPDAAQCATLTAARDAIATSASLDEATAVALGTASAALTVEAIRACAAAFGSEVLVRGLSWIRDGIVEVAVALNNDGTPPGLLQGLTALVDGLDEAIVAAAALEGGADLLSASADQLASGAGLLSNGLQAADDGANQLADAGGLVAEGAEGLAFGAREVAAGLAALSSVLAAAAEGGQALALGASALETEGLGALYTSIVQSSAQPAAATAYLAATNARAADALPYGLPEGATGSAAYLMVMDPVEPEQSAAWQYAALALLFASAIGGAIAKRVRGSTV